VVSTHTASGPPGPYTFTLTGGALPPGITLSPSGALTGTTTVANYETALRTVRYQDISDSPDPAAPDYIGRHPGTAFMEMQFYPPGWLFALFGQGTATQWTICWSRKQRRLKPAVILTPPR
jgi:hypothetical protein